MPPASAPRSGCSTATGRILASRQVTTGGGYNTQRAAPVHFGLAALQPVRVEVTFMTRRGRQTQSIERRRSGGLPRQEPGDPSGGRAGVIGMTPPMHQLPRHPLPVRAGHGRRRTRGRARRDPAGRLCHSQLHVPQRRDAAGSAPSLSNPRHPDPGRPRQDSQRRAGDARVQWRRVPGAGPVDARRAVRGRRAARLRASLPDLP